MQRSAIKLQTLTLKSLRVFSFPCATRGLWGLFFLSFSYSLSYSTRTLLANILGAIVCRVGPRGFSSWHIPLVSDQIGIWRVCVLGWLPANRSFKHKSSKYKYMYVYRKIAIMYTVYFCAFKYFGVLFLQNSFAYLTYF